MFNNALYSRVSIHCTTFFREELYRTFHTIYTESGRSFDATMYITIVKLHFTSSGADNCSYYALMVMYIAAITMTIILVIIIIIIIIIIIKLSP
jgi:hypothetical protein